MQGFSLRNVELYAYEDDKLIYKALGEMLFTHFGVSGPLVLSASAHMRRFGECKYRLSIDLKPGLDDKKLDARLLRDFEKYNNREFRNSLGDLAGRMMIPSWSSSRASRATRGRTQSQSSSGPRSRRS